MLTENTAAFLADFGVIAQVGTRHAAVLLDAPDANILGDRAQSTAYQMTFRAIDFPDLTHADTLLVAGNQYEVIIISSIDDGVFKHATLQRT